MLINGNIIQKKVQSNMKNDTEKPKGKLIFLNREKNQSTQQENQPHIIQIPAYGIITICLTIIGGILGVAWELHREFSEITRDITAIQKDIESSDTNITGIKTNIATLNEDVNNINEYLYNNNGVQDQLDDINSALNLKVITVPNDDEYSSIKTSVKQVSMPKAAAPTTLIQTSTIGLYEDGKPCLAKDVINEPILLTYTEGENEVYFYGTYNEHYQWNGYCVTNVYSLDGLLLGICESNFENGKRIDYKSLYLSTSDKWIYSDKNCSNEKNIGVNISYTLNYDEIKNFTSTNVRISDILYVDKFIETVNPKLSSYYYGSTSEELFNDDSGNAYEVIYNSDGTIKTLYVGQFENGTFNDQTGNAWDISYTDEYGFYVYNTGHFKNGNAINKSTTPISIDEINKIVSNYHFDCELNWRQN